MKRVLFDEKYIVDIKDDRYAFYCPISSKKADVYKKHIIAGKAEKHPVTEYIESELENTDCPVSLFSPFIDKLDKIHIAKVMRKKDIYLKCELYDLSGWIINFSKYLKNFELTEDKMYLEDCDYLGSEEIGLLLLQHVKVNKKLIEDKPIFKYLQVMDGYGAITNAYYMINFKVNLEDGVYDEFLNKITKYEYIKFIGAYDNIDKDTQYQFDGYTDELFYSATYFNTLFGIPFDQFGNYKIKNVYKPQMEMSPFSFYFDYKGKTLYQIVMPVKINYSDSFFNFIQKGGDAQ